MNDEHQSATLDLFLGAVAGGASTPAPGGVTSPLHEREDRSARRREDHARGGESAHEVAADRLAGLAGVDLCADEKAKAGQAIHHGIGIGPRIATWSPRAIQPRHDSSASRPWICHGGAPTTFADSFSREEAR